MKKSKSIFGAVLLSTVLAGNSFAGDFTGVPVFDFFGSVYNAIVSLVATDAACETRQCQTCRPTEKGGDSGCRPTQN